MKRLIDILYGSWYGAVALFMAVAVVLPFVNEMLDTILPNGLILGKEWVAVVLILAFVNLLVSAVVSLIRRKRRQALMKFILVIPLLFVLMWALLMLSFGSCRMSSAPSESWTEEYVINHVPVKPEQLLFCGGIASREPVYVFEVAGEMPDFNALGFTRDATGMIDPKARYGWMFSRFRNPIALEDPIRLRTKDTKDYYWLEALESGSRTFVIYHSL